MKIEIMGKGFKMSTYFSASANISAKKASSSCSFGCNMIQFAIKTYLLKIIHYCWGKTYFHHLQIEFRLSQKFCLSLYLG